MQTKQDQIAWEDTFQGISDVLAPVKGGVLVEMLHKVPCRPQAQQLSILWQLLYRPTSACLYAPSAVDPSATAIGCIASLAAC